MVGGHEELELSRGKFQARVDRGSGLEVEDGVWKVEPDPAAVSSRLGESKFARAERARASHEAFSNQIASESERARLVCHGTQFKARTLCRCATGNRDIQVELARTVVIQIQSELTPLARSEFDLEDGEPDELIASAFVSILEVRIQLEVDRSGLQTL